MAWMRFNVENSKFNFFASQPRTIASFCKSYYNPHIYNYFEKSKKVDNYSVTSLVPAWFKLFAKKPNLLLQTNIDDVYEVSLLLQPRFSGVFAMITVGSYKKCKNAKKQ